MQRESQLISLETGYYYGALLLYWGKNKKHTRRINRLLRRGETLPLVSSVFSTRPATDAPLLNIIYGVIYQGSFLSKSCFAIISTFFSGNFSIFNIFLFFFPQINTWNLAIYMSEPSLRTIDITRFILHRIVCNSHLVCTLVGPRYRLTTNLFF